MATINTGPAAVNTGATTTILGPLDRAPAPVSSAVDPQVPPPTPVFNRPVDRAPDPVVPGPGLGISSATATVASIPVTELPVDTANQTSSDGGTQTGTPIYIKVLSDGTVVTSPTTVLNFLGAGVSVTANGTQANITIIGSDYGNSNVVALLGAFGSNTISTAGNITGGNILANGSMSITGNLTVNGNATLSGNILGDRVQNGTTSFDIQTQNGNANITVAGTSNVVVFATTGVLVTGLITASGNITGGNVLTGGLISATGNITGGNILGGANVNATTHTGTTVSVSANVTGGNILTAGLISAAGNVTSGNVLTGGAVSATGNVAGNYFIGNGSQLSGLSTSSISNGTSNVRIAAANGNVTIAANASSTWTFDATGNLTLPANGDLNFNNGGITQSDGDDFDLQSFNSDGVVSSSLSMRPGDPSMRLEQWSGQDSNSWTTSDWATGTYTTQGGGSIGAVEFTGAANIINFVNSLTGTGQIYFSVNGGPQLAWDGTSSGGGTITFYTATLPATDPTTVTTFDYYYSYYSRIEIDYDAEEFNIETNNVDVTLSTTNQRDIDVNSSRDLGMQGNGSVTLRNNSTIDGIQIQTDTGNTNQTWAFDTAGNLTLPQGGIVYETNIPDGGLNGNTIALKPSGGSNADQQLMIYPTVNDANHLHLTSGNLYNTELFLGDDNLYVKLANTGNVVINSNDGAGNAAQWTFGADGNLTVPGGMTVSGNTNVLSSQTALLQPTDNIPLSLISSGTNGATTLLWAEDFANLMTSNIAAIYTPLQGSQTVRIVTGSNGGNIAIYDFDTDGTFTTGKVSATGNISSGNILIGGLISATANVIGGNVLTGGLISATGNITAGNIIATNIGNIASINLNGNASTVLYGNGVFAEVAGGSSYGNANVVANLAVLGSNPVSTTGNITSGNILTGGLVSATGNVTGGNVLTGGVVSAAGNVAGNFFIGNGSQLTGIAASYGDANVATFLAAFGSNTVSTTGNITTGNLLTGGLISATGNVTAANFFGNGSTLSNVATQVTGSWTVPVGNITQSFTVPINNMYQLWVLGNIPNGIIVYNATVSVSNTNVPVIGQQFAWNYEGGGNILMFTSIPAQIIGTAGAISNAQPAVSNTNVFSFGINNTSGNTVTVNYGWTKIS